jgi:ABC-2 type transport system permease protein
MIPSAPIPRPTRPVNWRAVFGIMRKDLRVVSQSKSVVIPMLIIPVIFFVLVPIGMAIALIFFGPTIEQSSDFQEILAIVPPFLRAQAGDATVVELAGLFMLRYMFAPLYLIMPIMASSVIAADSFAGEKERKTLEALLYTPTTDFELMLAKMLGALVPGVLLAWGTALLYWIVVDIAAWPIYGRPILPDITWLILALWVAPGAAAMALGATVIVSARAKSFQDAYQISGLVVLPVVILMLGQSFGLVALSPGVTLVVGLVFYALAAVLYLIGARLLQRSEILARL